MSPPLGTTGRPDRSRALARDPKGDPVRLHIRAMRFVLSGGSVAVYYLAMTTVLADVVGLPFQVALVIGYTTAICLHFVLQRFFVWAQEDGFALAAHRQAGRYLAVVVAQYGLTVLATAWLPGALGLPTELIYIAVASLLAITNFLVMGKRVFHRSRPSVAESPPSPSRIGG